MTAPTTSRWWTLLVVGIGTFMLMLDISVASIALPQIRASLHASFAELQWVFDAYALTLAAFLVTAGSIADRRGRRGLFFLGLLVFTAASLSCGLAPNAVALNVSRGCQGVGAAILFAVGPALLGQAFHGKERAMAFGVFGAVTGIAVASGPLIGGGLTSGVSWRWIFLLNVPLGVSAAVITRLRVQESRDPRARGADWAGMLTFTVALAAIVYALIRGNEIGWTSPEILAMYGISAVMLVAFVVTERRLGERAMFPLSFFRNVIFVGISLVALIANGSALPAIFLETNYVENIMHLSAFSTGVRFLPLTLALFVFGAVAGALTGRVPFRLLMGASCVALGIGLLLARTTTADSRWTALVPSMIGMGVGMGIFNPTRAALAIGVAEPRDAGVASGINETFQQVGIAVGIAGIGALFQHRVVSLFADSQAGHLLGGQAASGAARGISAGSLDSVAAAFSGLRDMVLRDGRAAFVAAFHDAMLACATCALAAAALAALLLRTKDLHASALSLVPPETETDAAERTAVAARS
ncbi:major facilitator superfamily MFS_1 [Acidothermus cellulolyticus 11B]|uniref:Major facilitator superfamily MFS_1 n=1 Tax=Acidothermus cellulolyticus (strain ATCC 43068 / DSM 8971 / 11B) TaxID=351607 RepID=A0LWP3_ACIC1|nr:MFS transporter [Acidothermus cellulolyticus]ABK53853.1 major facilitator superfamily MFS_1 [Acidothermus cellulolyticus 11B]